jgi:tryptophanyl-tRNA synthetase
VNNTAFENARDIISFGFDPERTFIFSNLDYVGFVFNSLDYFHILYQFLLLEDPCIET